MSETEHLMARFDKSLNDGRADETCGTCDKNFHIHILCPYLFAVLNRFTNEFLKGVVFSKGYEASELKWVGSAAHWLGERAAFGQVSSIKAIGRCGMRSCIAPRQHRLAPWLCRT